MTHQKHRAVKTPNWATFKVGLDDKSWNYIHKMAPSIEVSFQIFPDIEVIEVDFIKPDAASKIAYLSRVPKAWIRTNGELGVYVPDDDAYGISGYLLEIGEQMSPLDLSPFCEGEFKELVAQRFNLTFTPSACLVRAHRDPCDNTIGFDQDDTSHSLLLEGFTSHLNPGGSKSQRLSAQMSTICEILSKECGQTVELDKISGSRTKT